MCADQSYLMVLQKCGTTVLDPGATRQDSGELSRELLIDPAATAPQRAPASATGAPNNIAIGHIEAPPPRYGSTYASKRMNRMNPTTGTETDTNRELPNHRSTNPVTSDNPKSITNAID
jgi:hypothetical protein